MRGSERAAWTEGGAAKRGVAGGKSGKPDGTERCDALQLDGTVADVDAPAGEAEDAEAEVEASS